MVTTAEESRIPIEPKNAAVTTVKVPAPRKHNTRTHPPYLEMIQDAIETLKEKTGSSQYAITKFIEEKQKNLPPNFKKLLLVQLRKVAAAGKLVKVKGSYKLPSTSAPRSAHVSLAKKKLPPAASKLKAKPKATAGKDKKLVVLKSKVMPKSATAKSKVAANPAAKPKQAAKPKIVSLAKPNTATKRKALEKAKADKKRPVKVAKTSTRSTPMKKALVVKNTAGKPKTVKSPAKKTADKKGKK